MSAPRACEEHGAVGHGVRCTQPANSAGAPDSQQSTDGDPTIFRTADVVNVCRELIAEKGRMKAAITEAIALLENGTDYEKLHVVGTLRAGLG